MGERKNEGFAKIIGRSSVEGSSNDEKHDFEHIITKTEVTIGRKQKKADHDILVIGTREQSSFLDQPPTERTNGWMDDDVLMIINR
jgi:hypothetical protein